MIQEQGSYFRHHLLKGARRPEARAPSVSLISAFCISPNEVMIIPDAVAGIMQSSERGMPADLGN